METENKHFNYTMGDVDVGILRRQSLTFHQAGCLQCTVQLIHPSVCRWSAGVVRYIRIYVHTVHTLNPYHCTEYCTEYVCAVPAKLGLLFAYYPAITWHHLSTTPSLYDCPVRLTSPDH